MALTSEASERARAGGDTGGQYARCEKSTTHPANTEVA